MGESSSTVSGDGAVGAAPHEEGGGEPRGTSKMVQTNMDRQ
jgi:hypothetical protein